MTSAALLCSAHLLAATAAASQDLHSATRAVSIPLTESLTLEMIRVPPGEFLMGAADGEGPSRTVHRVALTRPFWLARCETTQEQWETVMGANPSHFQDPLRPVESVSWQEIRVFLETLTARVGGPAFRLPTEAEWEYACRAGTATHFPFGNDESLLAAYGWYRENSRGSTRPVGAKKPNPWGFHDMHGNVAEVCQDWFAPYSPLPQTDPAGPAGGDLKVFRGGRWFYPASKCRSDRRSNCPPNYRNYALGFRIARDAE